MRLHTTTVTSLTSLAILALAGCTSSSTLADDPVSSASAPTQQEGKHSPVPELLSSAALSKRLLAESDLGEGYSRKPQQPRPQDDVVVSGCPALEELGGDAAVGDSLDFPRKAKASFTYMGGSDSEVAEELYSDTAAKLSRGASRIFDAMISCPTYRILVSSTSVDMGTEQMAAPPLGDEQWSQLLTYSVGPQRSVVQQTAIRIANVLVIVSGSPGLVDAHLAQAVDKAQRTR
ncbi:hypothetical protein DMA15_20075 [Streptomyces sp. WAC 01529]|uniref:hypothetical protein n=1 Tax=Streptomyces sp. WAC 01529 TaxID=2203205 RepID=UPI000F6CDCEF|nr:hypothetical protein [Streptomyces sp. WAC 01529]AZM54574.1 hypothetical protein DMA15_20075 [Streptomyces sp. WAC 01529]